MNPKDHHDNHQGLFMFLITALTIKGGEPLCMLWTASLKKSLTSVWRIPPPLFTGKSFIFVSRNFTFIQWTSFLFDSRKLTCTYSLEKGSSLFDKMSAHLAATNTKNLWMKVRLWLMGFVSMGYQNCRSSFHPASSHVQAQMKTKYKVSISFHLGPSHVQA